jgi:hypothetical protein
LEDIAHDSALFENIVTWMDLDPTGPSARIIDVTITLVLEGTGGHSGAPGVVVIPEPYTQLHFAISGTPGYCSMRWAGLIEPF